MKTGFPASKTVLVLEDEAIIALDVEGLLTDAGFNVPTSLATSAKAFEWLNHNVPDVVVLDIDLHDGSSSKVAQWLLDRAVPFVVFSGSSPREPSLDPVFLAGEWLEKPAAAGKLVEAVRSLARSVAPA